MPLLISVFLSQIPAYTHLYSHITLIYSQIIACSPNFFYFIYWYNNAYFYFLFTHLFSPLTGIFFHSLLKLFQLRHPCYSIYTLLVFLLKEYPLKYDPNNEKCLDPYYAIINEENLKMYDKYKKETEKFKNIHLVGRLAEYKYYNMDAVVERALEESEKIYQ